MDKLGRAVKNLLGALKRSVRPKELVGADELGNKYYRWQGVLDGRLAERRQVKVAGADYLYDPKNLPTEWRMWLQKTRKEPPTDEELARSKAAAAALRQRVAVLEQAEQLRRVRQQTVGKQDAAAGGPDLGRFMQQVGGSEGAAAAAGSGRQQQGAAAAGGSQGAAAAGGEATGSGDSFKPGTWQPGR